MAMVFIFASKVQLSEVGRELQVDEKPTCLRMVGVGKVGWDGWSWEWLWCDFFYTPED